jgi:hypothetical protein
VRCRPAGSSRSSRTACAKVFLVTVTPFRPVSASARGEVTAPRLGSLRRAGPGWSNPAADRQAPAARGVEGRLWFAPSASTSLRPAPQ